MCEIEIVILKGVTQSLILWSRKFSKASTHSKVNYLQDLQDLTEQRWCDVHLHSATQNWTTNILVPSQDYANSLELLKPCYNQLCMPYYIQSFSACGNKKQDLTLTQICNKKQLHNIKVYHYCECIIPNLLSTCVLRKHKKNFILIASVHVQAMCDAPDTCTCTQLEIKPIAHCEQYKQSVYMCQACSGFPYCSEKIPSKCGQCTNVQSSKCSTGSKVHQRN